MRALLPVLTDQSTIIFIFFADTLKSKPLYRMSTRIARRRELTRARRGHKSGRRLAPKSGLNPDCFVAQLDSHSFQLVANRGFWGDPISNFTSEEDSVDIEDLSGRCRA